jgi:hypothetical protein
LSNHKTIEDAIEATYKEALKYADGVIVIDRTARLEFIDLGAQKILGVKRSDAEGSGLEVFLPERIRPMHRGWIDKEFSELDSALKTGNSYRGRLMGASTNSREPRYLTAQNFDGDPISIGLEFQPLFWGDHEDGFVGFISKDPAVQIEQRIFTQTEEAEKAVKNRQAQMGFFIADETTKRFTGGYYWLKAEVFKGWPLAGLWAFSVMFTIVSTVGFTVLVGTGIIKLPKPPQPQNFNFGSDYLQDDKPPSSKPSPKQTPIRDPNNP